MSSIMFRMLTLILYLLLLRWRVILIFILLLPIIHCLQQIQKLVYLQVDMFKEVFLHLLLIEHSGKTKEDFITCVLMQMKILAQK